MTGNHLMKLRQAQKKLTLEQQVRIFGSSYEFGEISDAVIRKAVFDEVLFDDFTVVEGTNGSQIPILFAAEFCYKRLLIWENYAYSPNTATFLSGQALTDSFNSNKQEIIKIENNLIEEEKKAIGGSSGGETNYLSEVFQQIYKGVSPNEPEIKLKTFFDSGTTRYKKTYDTKVVANFYRVFDPTGIIGAGNAPMPDVELVKKLKPTEFDSILNKIIESGLLQLASYSGEISTFAARRLKDKDSANKSAIEAFLPQDQPWLDQLIAVVQKLSKDPILLATINVYFPSLITFFFDALAASSDYSNGGSGGGDDDEINNLDEFAKSLQSAFGIKDGVDVFELAYNFNKTRSTSAKLSQVLKNSPYIENVSPFTPDIFHLRLGAANFYVPPLSININSSFKAGSLTGGALRQKNTPKFNSGYKETSITLRLFFPNYEEIWGISIEDASRITLKDNFVLDFSNNGDSEKKIDKFLSSLRGLVAAFKYSPFLPIKSSYLNQVHGITAVALSNMSIQTVPNFPFALAVDIELLNFNHKPLLPMISDFNQAIHWGKYRQYMGRAAGSLNRYINAEFLGKTSDVKKVDKNLARENFDDALDRITSPIPKEVYEEKYNENLLVTNVMDQWTDGNNISFYVPIETQTKIFLPDTNFFRKDNEELIDDQGEQVWEKVLRYFGFDINQSADYGISLGSVYDLSLNGSYNNNVRRILKDSIDILTARIIRR